VLIATSHHAAPARRGAFADERRVVGAATKAAHFVLELIESLPRGRGCRRSIRFARLERGLDALFAPARSSPLSIALRPRVGACSPIGAS
jgi:hypothetical protein